MKTLTPVLSVNSIEPSLKFWEAALGFSRAVQVPEEGPLAFVQLVKGGAAVMYQTIESVAGDLPALAEEMSKGPTFLYLTVEKLDDVIEKLEGFEVTVPRRTTFYGADEIGYREPGGHLVVFAEFPEM